MSNFRQEGWHFSEISISALGQEMPLWTHISLRVWASLPRRRGAEKRPDAPGQRARPQLFHTRGFSSPLVRWIGFSTRHTRMLLGIPCTAGTRGRTQGWRGNFLQIWLCPDLCTDKLGRKQSRRQDTRCEL